MNEWLKKALYTSAIDIAEIAVVHTRDGRVRVRVRDDSGEILIDKTLRPGEGYRVQLEKPT